MVLSIQLAEKSHAGAAQSNNLLVGGKNVPHWYRVTFSKRKYQSMPKELRHALLIHF